MVNSDTYRPLLAVAVAIAVAAVFGAIWMSRDKPALPVAELMRVEDLDSASSLPIADHIAWTFDVLGGERSITEGDMDTRFAPTFSAGFTAEDLNSSLAVVYESFGPIDFVRFREVIPESAEAIGVSAGGIPFLAVAELAPDGRMRAWGLDDLLSPPRLPGWKTGLALLASWLFLVASVVSRRADRTPYTWLTLAGSALAAATVLILSDSAAAYTVGRVLPPSILIIAAWLLMPTGGADRSGWLLATATFAALATASSALVRDSALIGHPAVVGSFTDSAALYRSLLAIGAVLAALALAGVAAINAERIRAVARWRRAPLLVASAVAGIWAVASLASAIDYTIGDGVFAEGALNGVTLGALAAVPGVVAFRSATSRWNRPELAGLVIDLEAGGGDLRGAVADALEDRSVKVLRSPDGLRLLDDTGADVRAEDLPEATAIARIHAGGQLVGGLLHEADRRHPERLQAVVAALGMALEVGRLNDKVLAQLDEVEASRARIVDASDQARRRLERDLHDGAQQRLVAIGLELQRARKMAAAAGYPELTELLENTTGEVRGTIDDIRSVARGSDPALLRERGLTAAVEALAERASVPVLIDVAGDPPPTEAQRTAYFVIAEGLTNIAKHAEASEAVVRVHTNAATTTIEVIDNGRGGAHLRPSSGLQGLEDRVAAAGGDFSVASGSTGTLLRAVIPCG